MKFVNLDHRNVENIMLITLDDTIKEIIMKFVDDINIEKTNRHFYDDNDSKRYC